MRRRGRDPPLAEQLAPTTRRYRAQLAYLFERSPFYRDKLAAAGFASAEAAGGLAEIARAAAHREARAQGHLHGRQPDRRAPVRAAGGDRPDLLDQRHHRHAELHPADRRRPRQLGHRLGAQLRGVRRRRRPAHRQHLQRRAVRGRRGARGVRPHRPLPHPGRHRQHRAPAAKAIELLRPTAAVLTPSYAAYLVEWAAERDFDLRGSSVERVLVAGEPGGGEPAFRAMLEEGWGARVTEAMGIGDIGAVALGRVRAAGRDAPRRARLRPRRADRPGDGRGASRSTTARPASSC